MGQYDDTFYATIREGIQRSAAVVVPLVYDLVRPKTVLDVGCGEGWWAQGFADMGCEVIGVDGDYVASSPLGDRFLPHDLTGPLPEHLWQRFDLAVCLEVAEHLPYSRAESFVDDLCHCAPIVLFSAAIPGQGGTGHVNEQWPDYWVDLFAEMGYECTGALRWPIWNDARVENWYRQNLMLAVNVDVEIPAVTELLRSPLAPMWPVVHPVLYQARRR